MRSDAACFASYRFSMLSLLALLTMLLVSCGGGGRSGPVTENRSIRGYNPGVGPFDNQGNYVERWANDKSKGNWWRKSIVHEPVAPATTGKPAVIAAVAAPKPTARPAASSPKPTPAKPAAAATPTSKPAVAITAKPKSKPPVRHVIKKGDTLWALSRKYNTTVTAIQRANGLKGSNLKIGRTLLIPRY